MAQPRSRTPHPRQRRHKPLLLRGRLPSRRQPTRAVASRSRPRTWPPPESSRRRHPKSSRRQPPDRVPPQRLPSRRSPGWERCRAIRTWPARCRAASSGAVTDAEGPGPLEVRRWTSRPCHPGGLERRVGRAMTAPSGHAREARTAPARVPRPWPDPRERSGARPGPVTRRSWRLLARASLVAITGFSPVASPRCCSAASSSASVAGPSPRRRPRPGRRIRARSPGWSPARTGASRWARSPAAPGLAALPAGGLRGGARRRCREGACL